MRTSKLMAVLAVTAGTAVAVVGFSAAPAIAVDTGPQKNVDNALHLAAGSLSNTSDYPNVKVFARWSQFDTSGISSEYGYAYSYNRNGGPGRPPILQCRGIHEWAEHDRAGRRVGGTLCQCHERQRSDIRDVRVPCGTSLAQESAANYNAGWTTGNCLCWSGGAILKSNAAGQVATYRFYGDQVGLLSEKRARGGTADLYIDGSRVASFNSAGDTLLLVVPARYKVQTGQHTLQVRVTSGRFDVDGFVATARKAVLAAIIVVGDGSLGSQHEIE